MQSRLAVSKLNRILFATPKFETIPRFSSASSGEGAVSVHGGEDAMTQGVDTEGETRVTNPDDQDNLIPTREDDRYVHPKTVPPNLSCSKLETPGVNTRFDPHVQQKRSKFTIRKEELTCAGLDGSPWPDDKSGKKEQEEDNKECFEHHKASPLAEIEIVDSRKPLARVTNGTAGGYFGDEQVITWRPEQLDTAEESLRRATEMFREAAARGVPEWPHSVRLRQLRGEDW